MNFRVTAAAVCGALFVMSAGAAGVSVYGVLDTGLSYTKEHHGDSRFEMTSGNYAGPRFGLRGSEDLGTNLKVSFILESGFADDTGELSKNGTLFNRESQIALSGDWGRFGMGRVGAFTSGSSSLSWYWDLEPFETGYVDAGIQATQQNVWLLHSNTFYYVSPTVGGAKFGLQYGMNDKKDAEETHFSHNNSWLNAAVRWDGNGLRAAGGVEAVLKGNDSEEKDAWSVKLAGAWQPEGSPLTLYAGMNWWKNFRTFADATWDGDLPASAFNDSGRSLEGLSGFTGAKFAAGATDILGLVQYLDGSNKGAAAGAEKDFSRLVLSLGLHHHLSQRTMLYAIGAWADGDGLLDDNATNRMTAHVGLTHFF